MRKKKWQILATAAMTVSANMMNTAEVSQMDASSFLSRIKRANSFAEEFRGGDMERECIEEVCSQDEMVEIFKAEDRSLSLLNKEFQKYERCLYSYPSLSGTAKKQKLKECMEDEDHCPNMFGPCNPEHTDQCIDLVGKAECKCKHGYGDELCNSITDLCILEPCGPHGHCQSKYKAFECNCDQNWEGTNCTIEILDCRRVGHPEPGQEDDIYSCNERNGICKEGEIINDVGSGSCECFPGWVGAQCNADENECETGSHECDLAHGICVNEYGSYKCKCKEGFILDTTNSKTCTDIDECHMGNGGCADEPEGGCLNTEGSYQCYCNDGYKLDIMGKRKCWDVDECAKNDGGCDQICSNTKGSYNCRCNAGYYLADDDHTCIDADECDCDGYDPKMISKIRFFDPNFQCISNGGCEQICKNNDGSYSCSCNVGYELHSNNRKCLDINECMDADTNNCDNDIGHCLNDVGSYACACDSGYTLAGDGFACEDVDECTTGTHKCKNPAFCVNELGSYRCECPEGYKLLGRQCQDIDECRHANPCVHGKCHNLIGSFYCDCIETGFTGKICDEDLDECKCAEGDGEYALSHQAECTHPSVADQACEQICTNTVGSFKCSCDRGWFLNGNGHSCDDLDECKCTNDITYKDEKPECGDVLACHHGCENHKGGYACLCNEGYYLKNKQMCEPVDECRCQTDKSYYQEVQKTSEACQNVDGRCEQECIDITPGYECACMAGYRLNLDGHRCDDVNECQTNQFSCPDHSECANTIGNYTCQCNDGYILVEDKCEENLECPARNKCDAAAHGCRLEKGIQICYCNEGFLLQDNGKRCMDIDECSGGLHNCSIRQVCQNSDGGFVCIDEQEVTQCEASPELTQGSLFHTGADYDGQSYGSHIRYSKFKANEEFDISFQFKTFDKEGQLLYWSSKSKKKLTPKKGTKKNSRRLQRNASRRKSRKSDDEHILISFKGDIVVINVLTSKEKQSETFENEYSNGSSQTIRINYNNNILTIQLNNKNKMSVGFKSLPALKTMYFGGATIPPCKFSHCSSENAIDEVPSSSFDACFDFLSDSSFDSNKFEAEENSDPRFCFKNMDKGVYINGGEGKLDITHVKTLGFGPKLMVKDILRGMATIKFAFKPESTQGDIIKIGNIKLSLEMARLKIEINDKQGPRDIPLEYWASEKCGELHRIRIKSCIYTDCPDYKKTQITIDNHPIGLYSKWNLSDELEGFIPSRDVTAIEIGGDNFRGAFYPYRFPPSEDDVPFQAHLLPGHHFIPINNFIHHSNVFTNSAPSLSSKDKEF